MLTVNMLEAKSSLSRLVEAVESGAESEIIIARNGKPAAKLVPLEGAKEKKGVRLGLLAGKYPPMSLEDLNSTNDEIAALFYGSDD
ncbi:type II toxin-antitoxin system prevent-host-death family antitoxin [Mesorhizobium sp. KR1-2]|uniref:type II toxin-antitoxin system Phd/YefM family antitoxin n=1 Tax=Mesorhizobium sp. KR1-2 TaxID=3156609 RepID=UPI0032B433E3